MFRCPRLKFGQMLDFVLFIEILKESTGSHQALPSISLDTTLVLPNLGS